jgi:transposase-like protein
LAKQFGLQPNQITDWKRQLIEREAVRVGGETDAGPWMGLAQLHAKRCQGNYLRLERRRMAALSLPRWIS